MAARKHPTHSPRGPKATGSLREQLRPLAKQAKRRARVESAPEPPRAAPPPPPLTFRELIEEVHPMPPGAELAQPAAARGEAGGGVIRLPPRPRLWVEEEGPYVRGMGEGVSRKVCQDLELGRIVPRREVDLHRLGAAAAREALGEAVALARQEGASCLLVLVGRGLHSRSGDAILPEVVVQYLAEVLAGEVLALASAPRKWGGAGALLVLVKPRGGAAAGTP